jgi:uncharacterized protein (DUF362 family)
LEAAFVDSVRRAPIDWNEGYQEGCRSFSGAAHRKDEFTMKSISRRQFLKATLALPLSTGLPRVGLAGESDRSGTKPRIVEAQGPVEIALDMLLQELGGIERFVKRGNTVLLKPNMSFPNPPELATTTDPSLVRAMIIRCLRAGAGRILVADHPMRPVGLCLEETGMRAACDGFREVHLLGASQEGMFQEVSLSGTLELRQIKILRAVLQSDVLINLPRMKSHGATTVSLGTKGNMGLIWDRASLHGRMDLNEAIGDLNTRIRADLTILDGSRVLTAGGPLGPGPVEEPGCLIGGTDPVAVDAYGVQRIHWYGRPILAMDVPHLVACHERGIGEIDLDRADVVSRKALAP